jgi:hypothetical protein
VFLNIIQNPHNAQKYDCWTFVFYAVRVVFLPRISCFIAERAMLLMPFSLCAVPSLCLTCFLKLQGRTSFEGGRNEGRKEEKKFLITQVQSVALVLGTKFQPSLDVGSQAVQRFLCVP